MDTMQGIDIKVHVAGAASFTARNVRTVREALAQYADANDTSPQELARNTVKVGNQQVGLDHPLQKGDFITLSRRIEGGDPE